MRLQLRFIGFVVAMLLAWSPLSSATDITFDFTALPSGLTSYNINSGGYTLTLFNPVNSGVQANQFALDPVGILLGVHPSPFTAGFDMSVTGGSLKYLSYEIGYAGYNTVGDFSLNGGTGTSTGNTLNPAGSYNFAGSKIINPGDTVTLTASFTAGSISQIKFITFSTVPEPSTYALAAIATGVMAAIARRRKACLG